MAVLKRLVGLVAFAAATHAYFTTGTAPIRTVVTTDMEQDDFASLVRYLLYTNDLETQGLIYTASRYHWAGDGKGTKFFHADREYNTSQTSWRWTGNTTIQDVLIPAYAEVYSNLLVQDPFYPSPAELLSITKLGNIDFEGEMDHDTDGSNLIKSLLLDDDPRPLYLQAWGGINTIGRALKSIEDTYCNTAEWSDIQAAVSNKAVIMASGFQDDIYTDYVAPTWPAIRVENFAAGYATWAYNCNAGKGNTRGLPDANLYFSGSWIKQNIETGPYGRLYRSWLDGQRLPGDQLDGFGNLTTAKAEDPWCPALSPYDFLSEGDNVAYNPLLPTGLQAPENPALGGWGGRSVQNSTYKSLWQLATLEKNQTGSNEINTTSTHSYTTERWAAAIQNDFAARIQWTLTSNYSGANHAPAVAMLSGDRVEACAGSNVTLVGWAKDPDQGDHVTTSWWQYLEEGTYPQIVTITQMNSTIPRAVVSVPSDAKAGETVSIIFQGTDSGQFPLTRYGRVMIEVV